LENLILAEFTGYTERDDVLFSGFAGKERNNLCEFCELCERKNM